MNLINVTVRKRRQQRAHTTLLYFYKVQKQARENCILKGDSISSKTVKNKEVISTQVRIVVTSRRRKGNTTEKGGIRGTVGKAFLTCIVFTWVFSF